MTNDQLWVPWCGRHDPHSSGGLLLNTIYILKVINGLCYLSRPAVGDAAAGSLLSPELLIGRISRVRRGVMGSLRTRLRGTAPGSLAALGRAAVVGSAMFASAGAASAAPAGSPGWGPLVRVADGILLGTVNSSTRQ